MEFYKQGKQFHKLRGIPAYAETMHFFLIHTFVMYLSWNHTLICSEIYSSFLWVENPVKNWLYQNIKKQGIYK